MATGAAPGLPNTSDNAPAPPILPRFLPLMEYPPVTTNGNTTHPPRYNTAPSQTPETPKMSEQMDEETSKFSSSARPASTAAIQRARSHHAPPCSDKGTPKQSNAQDPQFKLVLNNKKAKSSLPGKLPPTTGILLTRIGPRKVIERQFLNMGDILSALSVVDPNAYLLPHNCDASRMVKIQQMLNARNDYTSFMDITRTNWGKPSENKTRIALSFYVASEVIREGLDALKKSLQVQAVLENYKLTMLPHNLLQSDSKAIAFFCGKSPTHTWRDDLRRRFQLYTDTYLTDSSAVTHVFGEDTVVPSNIPFYFRVTMLRNKTVKTPAITLYVGQSHVEYMHTLLEKIPFPDVQLILLSQKRSDPAIFNKQIVLHKTLCDRSRAVKLKDTSEDF